jgi:2-iminobutanoate/2-iminopropanoate deaminase
MKPIYTPAAPRPAGHYSQAIAHGGLLWISGQLPIEPVTGVQNHGPIEEQTACALRNVDAILSAGGSSRARVLRVTIYVAEIAHWPRVNAVYAEFFAEHRPARAVVPVLALHHGSLIEIEAVAAIDPT